MAIIINLLLNAIAVVITAYVLPGVHVANFFTAIVVAVALGIVNAIIKPILVLVTLPINIITLGLFTFILNGLLILLVSTIVPGFHVDNFLWAMLFSIILSIVNAFFSSIRNS
jgi:putative membrane protein